MKKYRNSMPQKKRFFLPLLMGAVLLPACQTEDDADLSSQDRTVSITARIGKATPEARYSQTSLQEVGAFVNGDEIGLFMDDEAAVRWAYGGINWTSDVTLYWPDKDQKHAFCAYYPYVAADAKTAVTMPSLGSQDGTQESIQKYDFLVATKTLSYNEDNGNVAFTGDNAFKHVSSLLQLTIKGGGDVANATITKVVLSGTGIISQTSYSFTSETVSGQSASEETLYIAPAHEMNGDDVTYYFVLNGTDSPVNLSIEYSKDSKNYLAEREEFAAGLQSGYIYTYDVIVKGGTVIISGGSISGWTPGNEGEEIIINGEEVPEGD